MEHLEIELKFYISNFVRLRRRLRSLEATCIGQRTFEYNARYDAEDGRLQKSKCLLRLRKDQDTRLTFKSPPPEPGNRFKVYRELEVSVNDAEGMDAILNALGYFRCQVYEKWRETWQLNEAAICMDTLPFGRFIEIEGSAESIMLVVERLGLRWERRILSSYLGIFENLRHRKGLMFTDVTFDNFKTVAIHFERYAHLFEAGDPGEK